MIVVDNLLDLIINDATLYLRRPKDLIMHRIEVDLKHIIFLRNVDLDVFVVLCGDELRPKSFIFMMN